MLKVIIFVSCVIAAAFAQSAVNCATAANGDYCTANGGYTLCSHHIAYNFNCPTGTACQCGTGTKCSTPCTTACETGSTPARDFCTARLSEFVNGEGYFCDAAGDGFYHCIEDPYCSTQASIQSAFLPCGAGTECRCGNTFEECSNLMSETPCDFPSQYQPYVTTANPPPPPSASSASADFHPCDGHGFTCGGDITSCDASGPQTSGQCSEGFNLCATSTEGTDICVDGDSSCGLNCASTADCPELMACFVNTCCGVPSCGYTCQNS